MPSDKFKTSSSGRSARNAANNFLHTFSGMPPYPYGNIFSSNNMNASLDESSLSDQAHHDKRSAHNALERQRRENLNSKFQQLAHALPSLQSVRRPSKSVIVAKSLEFVSNSPSRETTFQNQIEQLRRENERLRNQVQRSKLHLKGNNASTSSFRERTASVAAPALTESSANTVSSSAEQDSSPPIADSSSSPSKRMSRLSMSSSSTDSSSRKRHKQPKRVPSSTSSLQTDDRRSSVDSRFRSATAIGPAPPLDHNNEVLYSHMTMQPADFLNDATSPGNHIGGLAATTANIPMDPRLLQGPDMMLFSPPTPAPQQPEVPYSNAPQMLNVAAMHSQHHPQQQQILPGAFLTPQQASMIGDFLSFMDARYPQLYPASFMPVSFQQTAASSSTTASSTSGTSVGTFPQPYIQTNSNEGYHPSFP